MVRHLKLDDLYTLNNPTNIAKIFEQLGYDACLTPIDPVDFDLSPRNLEAIYDTQLIANQGESDLQVILFQLHPEEWSTPSHASTRMKSIASQLGQRGTKFLLLATTDYNQLMLINPRKGFDEQTKLKASIRKLLIDRTNPTAYDLDRLEAIAVNNQSPQDLYKAQCVEFL